MSIWDDVVSETLRTIERQLTRLVPVSIAAPMEDVVALPSTAQPVILTFHCDEVPVSIVAGREQVEAHVVRTRNVSVRDVASVVLLVDCADGELRSCEPAPREIERENLRLEPLLSNEALDKVECTDLRKGQHDSSDKGRLQTWERL